MNKTFLKKPTRSQTVSFSVRGQLVVPSWLRKEYEIKPGTQALAYPTEEGILIKPITHKHIRSLRGSLRHSKAMEVFLNEREQERER